MLLFLVIQGFCGCQKIKFLCVNFALLQFTVLQYIL